MKVYESKDYQEMLDALGSLMAIMVVMTVALGGAVGILVWMCFSSSVGSVQSKVPVYTWVTTIKNRLSRK